MNSASQTTTKTTCPYCGVGCGVIVTRHEDASITVKGDPDHPANFGRLCSKGSALAETLSLNGRLLEPKIRYKDGFEASSWDQATRKVAEHFQQCISEHGPESVAFYVSGQLLTEDYYVANKLMKGYIGTANIDTNSRLCMSSPVIGHKKAFGSDTVPTCYEDIEHAELILILGANMAWCHPVLYQRIKAAKKNNPELKVVLFDPRTTSTAEIADLHLKLTPGSDHLILLGLLHQLEFAGLLSEQYMGDNLQQTLQQAQALCPSREDMARLSGVDQAQIETLLEWVLASKKMLSFFSQGMNQWINGSDNASALINLHLASGRIGYPGAGPFSLTGQPNAMGGREVGGLANQLAAHMDFEPDNTDRVQRFWNSPNIATEPGLKAVDLFQAMNAGKIKAVWIMGTNPAVSLPDSNKVREALKKCPFVVVSDCVESTDTNAYADVLLPAANWGEKTGMVTNSERRISLQRQFIEKPQSVRPDWWIISQIAIKMGFNEGFDFDCSGAVFQEHIELTSFENNSNLRRRDLDLGLLAGMSKQTFKKQYKNWKPIQWPLNNSYPEGRARFFDQANFYTPSGQCRYSTIEANVKQKTTVDYPLILNSGRIRDQWHTMTRTAKAAQLNLHIREPFVQMAPITAMSYGLQEGHICQINSQQGKALARVLIDPEQSSSSVFIPMHWSDQNTSLSAVNRLTEARVDPQSGQPQFKHTAVQLGSFEVNWRAFVLSHEKLSLEQFGEQTEHSYWCESTQKNHYLYFIEANNQWCSADDFISKIKTTQGEEIEYQDQSKGIYRCAHLSDKRLEQVVFLSHQDSLPAQDWLSELMNNNSLSHQDRLHILSAKPPGNQSAKGKIICACFGVGINTIKAAIQEQKLTNTAEITNALKAGGNCGSCLPEIKQILNLDS